jgi:uncharacterized membrane protein YphA (DoxX/SURF4 family)
MALNTQSWQRIREVLTWLGVYFISLVLISFGFSKFYNGQFQIYQHTGYMPLNKISRFTHAWSFFGRSYVYNLFLGIIEVSAGIMILFRRTRLMALLIALALLINILIIDLEFDVKNAVGHVVIELLIVLLLLWPYAKELKSFFWDRQGRWEMTTRSQRFFNQGLPWIFIGLLLTALTVEAKYFLDEQKRTLSQYTLRSIEIQNDTLPLSAGKYTPEPMLFFEFGNTCIFSINDTTLWGDYQLRGDSVFIILDKHLADQKKIRASFNPSRKSLNGLTDQGKSIRIQMK